MQPTRIELLAEEVLRALDRINGSVRSLRHDLASVLSDLLGGAIAPALRQASVGIL